MTGSGIQKQNNSLLRDAYNTIHFSKLLSHIIRHRLCWTIEASGIILSITDNNDDSQNNINNLQKHYPQRRFP